MPHCYHTYIVASKSRCLYIGVTGQLVERVGQRKRRLPGHKGFSSLNRSSQLVYYETTTDVHAAIAREKHLKGWRGARKVALVSAVNPAWRDLARMAAERAVRALAGLSLIGGATQVITRSFGRRACGALPQDDSAG